MLIKFLPKILVCSKTQTTPPPVTALMTNVSFNTVSFVLAMVMV